MATTDRIRTESYRDPDQLQREIDEQRRHVASLIGELEGRLSPGELMQRVLGASKEGGKDFATNLSHAVRANPLPALLTAGGMLWLYALRDRPIQRDVYETTTTAEGPGMRDRLSERTGSAKDFARRKADAARTGFEHMLEDNPVALGAMGVAVGALLGAMLPSTESEDRWMGEMRDRVRDGIRDGAREASRPNGSGAPTAH